MTDSGMDSDYSALQPSPAHAAQTHAANPFNSLTQRTTTLPHPTPTPTQSITIKPAVQRFPRSGLQLFNRRFLFGAEELCPVSACSLFTTLALLLISSFALKRSHQVLQSVTDTSTTTPTSTTESALALCLEDNLLPIFQPMLIFDVICYSAILLLDLLAIVLSVTNNMFKRPIAMERVLYARIVFSLLVILAVFSTSVIYFRDLHNCTSSTQEHSDLLSSLYRTTVALFICALLQLVVLTFYVGVQICCGELCGGSRSLQSYYEQLSWVFSCFCYTSEEKRKRERRKRREQQLKKRRNNMGGSPYNIDSDTDIETDHDDLDLHDKDLNAETGFTNSIPGSTQSPASPGDRNQSVSSTQTDVLLKIAGLFQQFLSRESHYHITPSDLLTGFALVNASQKLRKEAGYQFFRAASSKRWDEQYIRECYELNLQTFTRPPCSQNKSHQDVGEHEKQVEFQYEKMGHEEKKSAATMASAAADSNEIYVHMTANNDCDNNHNDGQSPVQVTDNHSIPLTQHTASTTSIGSTDSETNNNSYRQLLPTMTTSTTVTSTTVSSSSSTTTPAQLSITPIRTTSATSTSSLLSPVELSERIVESTWISTDQPVLGPSFRYDPQELTSNNPNHHLITVQNNTSTTPLLQPQRSISTTSSTSSSSSSSLLLLSDNRVNSGLDPSFTISHLKKPKPKTQQLQKITIHTPPDLTTHANTTASTTPNTTNTTADTSTIDYTDPDRDLALIASSGVQPRLDPRDWNEIQLGTYYYKYSEATYNWPLYLFDHWTCLFTGCRILHNPSNNKSKSHSKNSQKQCTPLLSRVPESGCDCTKCFKCMTSCCTLPQSRNHYSTPPPHSTTNYRCCHWSVNTFLNMTHTTESDLLYAQLNEHHHSHTPVYYCVLDHSTQSLVICIRGTLSVADLITDMDAELASLSSWGYPHSYTHSGLLLQALNLKKHILRKNIVEPYLRSNPHYRLVLTGHSLGAGTAVLLTLLLGESHYLSSKLKCFAFGPPLLLDPILAQSPFVMKSITTFVYGNDMICRLSLASLYQLKQQVAQVFQFSIKNKFNILKNVMKKEYTQVFEEETPIHQLTLQLQAQQKQLQQSEQSGLVDEEKKNSNGDSSGASVITSELLNPLFVSGGSEISIHVEKQKQVQILQHHRDGTTTQQIQTKPTTTTTPPTSTPSPSTSPLPTTNFSLHLRRSYLAGRIYHILPVKKSPQNLSRCERFIQYLPFKSKKKKRLIVVYPAAQNSFNEILTTDSMFRDHFPDRYHFQDLPFPLEFSHISDCKLPGDA